MAIKKPISTETVSEPTSTQAEPNTTALTLFGSTQLFSVEPPRDTANLLPQLKVPYPIEMGEVFRGEHINKLCLFDGKTATALAAPYILTVIAAKPASREETKDAQGKVKYVRAFAGGESNAKHIDFVEKSKAKVAGYLDGNSYIVAVVSDQGVTIAELAAFKTQKDYWGRPLYQARVQQGAGIQVVLSDHGVNTTVSKTGMKYLDPKKFVQYKPVELTRDQLEAISAVFEAQKTKFDAWLKQ